MCPGFWVHIINSKSFFDLFIVNVCLDLIAKKLGVINDSGDYNNELAKCTS